MFALETPSRTLIFKNVARRPALSAFRGFSAPVTVEDDLTEADLIALLTRDSDPFNRWQALQTLAVNLLKRSVQAIRERKPPEIRQAFVDAYGAVAADALSQRIDPAFAALALHLPSEADLAREIGRDVDPDAIRAAREALRGRLGRAHAAALSSLHASMRNDGPFSPDAASAGRRALRNGALAMLVAGDAIEGGRARLIAIRGRREHDREIRRARRAVDASRPAREHALENFGRVYAAEPLILDKWFALAGADRRARTRSKRVHGAHAPPRLLARQPQPHARAGWRLHRQPDAVQPRRRGRL